MRAVVKRWTAEQRSRRRCCLFLHLLITFNTHSHAFIPIHCSDIAVIDCSTSLVLVSACACPGCKRLNQYNVIPVPTVLM